MEDSPPKNGFPQPRNSRFSTKKGRSGYEPSDTETEWQEFPRHGRERKALILGSEEGTNASIALHRKHPSRFENETSTPTLTRRRNHSKSPYKPQMKQEYDDNDDDYGLKNTRRNISPLPKPDLGRYVSPYKPEREKHKQIMNGTKHDQRAPHRDNRNVGSRVVEVDRVSEKPNHRRAITAPRLRGNEKHQQNNYGQTLQNGGRTTSPFMRAPSVGEINERVGQLKLSSSPNGDHALLESTDSIQPGDLFFSRDCNALQLQKTTGLAKSIEQCGYFSPRPVVTASPSRGTPSNQQKKGNGYLNMNSRGTSSSNVLSRSTAGPSSAATSRKGGADGKQGGSGSVKCDASGKTTESMRKFTASRKKSQKETWFPCMRKGNCRSSRKSPERRLVDEASLIDRALVVESLPQFWADKHQPASLNGFICNKQEAQLLKELVSQGVCPHILLKGPSGSGKRALAMALLREIYGDACWNLSHNLRHFPIQEKRSTKVSVPITYSSHHMELNVNSEPNAKFALMGLVKEISNEYAITPEVSNMNFKADYKVIVLHEVDKAAESVQHMTKWIIDRYSDICKLVLCCEDDVDVLELSKNRFKFIKVDAPGTHEIAEVLIQIAKKEDINLSMSFAVKIATKSKQNLRKAIMALEACTAHNYPFSEEQPISVGWEESVIEAAVEILNDPSNSRLFSIRGKFQMLLVDFVHPRLILQKLVEHFLKRIDANLKRELYYWHGYYDKRLPPGTTALLKLEEFVAKFMSIYRKSSSSRQYV